MKKKPFLLLCVQVFTFFLCAQAQDYVITWDAYAVICNFPDKPRKRGDFKKPIMF